MTRLDYVLHDQHWRSVGVIANTNHAKFCDRKPKRSRTLRRIENTRVRPDVTILVDHYEEDWTRLWWMRLRGRARVLDQGEERERALMLLSDKYPQYRGDPPNGPVLAVDVTEVREWVS